MLNGDNLTLVLREAGIQSEHKHAIAEHLGLSKTRLDQVLGYLTPVRQIVNHFKNPQERQVWGKLLETWRAKDPRASWEKLAKAIENIPEKGVLKAQVIREHSGAGTHISVNRKYHTVNCSWLYSSLQMRFINI